MGSLAVDRRELTGMGMTLPQRVRKEPRNRDTACPVPATTRQRIVGQAFATDSHPPGRDIHLLHVELNKVLVYRVWFTEDAVRGTWLI